MSRLRAEIVARLAPCACGCKGRDPWHARSFERALSEVEEASGTCEVTAYREPQAYRRTALARLPWTGIPVRVVEVVVGRSAIGWFVVRG